MASKFLSSSGEEALQRLIDCSQRWNVDDIKDVVTAKDLYSCRDPIIMAFKVITIIMNYRSDIVKSNDNNYFTLLIPTELSFLTLHTLAFLVPASKLLIKENPGVIELYSLPLDGDLG